jgi:hypothetical protein
MVVPKTFGSNRTKTTTTRKFGKTRKEKPKLSPIEDSKEVIEKEL